MEKSDSIAKLAEALVKAQAELKVVEKDAINPFFKSKYADLPAIMKEYQRVFPKHGIAITQFPDGNGLRTTICHTSGEYMSSVAVICPVKNDPQAIGSAITYMRRYALAAVCGIVSSEDDDDGHAATHAPTEKPKAEAHKYAKNDNHEGHVEKSETNNGWTKVTIGGMEFSTKKEEIIKTLIEAERLEALVRVKFVEQVKGKFTNRYIDIVEIVTEEQPY